MFQRRKVILSGNPKRSQPVHLNQMFVTLDKDKTLKFLCFESGSFWQKILPAVLKIRSTGADDSGMSNTIWATRATRGNISACSFHQWHWSWKSCHCLLSLSRYVQNKSQQLKRISMQIISSNLLFSVVRYSAWMVSNWVIACSLHKLQLQLLTFQLQLQLLVIAPFLFQLQLHNQYVINYNWITITTVIDPCLI